MKESKPYRKWLNDRSRMNREVHVRFCESLQVKLLRATRLSANPISGHRSLCSLVPLSCPPPPEEARLALAKLPRRLSAGSRNVPSGHFGNRRHVIGQMRQRLRHRITVFLDSFPIIARSDLMSLADKIEKLAKIVLILFFVPAFILISSFFISPFINDLILSSFADGLFKQPLPPKTVLIEKSKDVGCLIGNGDHCDFLAIMFIKTELSKEEIERYYSNVKIKPPKKFDYNFKHNDVQIEVFLRDEAEEPFDGRGVYVKSRKEKDSANIIIENGKEYRIFIVQAFESGYPPGFDLRCN